MGTPTINYAENHGSPQNESLAESGRSATMILRCAWEDRWALMEEILLPFGWRYPHYPVPPPGYGDVRPIATSCGCKPFLAKNEGEGQECAYDTALITVQFQPSRITEEEETYDIYAESIEPTAEFLTLDHSLFAWGSANGDALKPDEAPGRVERGLDYVYTRYRQATLPAKILTLPGSVNASAITSASLGLTFAAETLLFNPPSIDRTMATDGSDGFTSVYRLSYKKPGWNVYWRSATQKYQAMYLKDGDGEVFKPYEPQSFSGL